MNQALSWLDSSSDARRRTLEAVKLFEDKGTVDELGIGTVRDALSDILFPGTSVLHTRARYIFFIAWIYRALEDRRTTSSEVAKAARKHELRLIQPLLSSDDPAGTIGRIARDKLKVLPSSMYWTGLHVWGCRTFEGSQDQYHRSLDRFYRRAEYDLHDDDGQVLDGRRLRNWHHGTPEPPREFPGTASFDLTIIEAEYLRERLLTQCPGTLLTLLVDRCRLVDDIDFVWEHPEVASFPEHNQAELDHARNFSEGIHGAALLYNLMLAQSADNEDLISDYEEQLAEWGDSVESRQHILAAWDRNAFWALAFKVNPRIAIPTRSFVNEWLDLALGNTPGALASVPHARDLIAFRERAMKGGLARLVNRDALNRWTGASGTAQLSYRWNPQVQRMLTDIQRGLKHDA